MEEFSRDGDEDFSREGDREPLFNKRINNDNESPLILLSSLSLSFSLQYI